MRIVTRDPILAEPGRPRLSNPLAPLPLGHTIDREEEISYDSSVPDRVRDLLKVTKRQPFALVAGKRAYWSIVAHLVARSTGGDPRHLTIESHALAPRGTFTLPDLLPDVAFCLLSSLPEDAVEFATRP